MATISMSIPTGFRGGERDAALPRPGVHPRDQLSASLAELPQQPFEQSQVHAADQGWELAAETVEGTVAQPQCRALPIRFIAALREDGFGVRLAGGRVAGGGLAAERLAVALRGGVQRQVGAAGLDDLSEQVGGGLVAARRQGQFVLGGGAPVELRRPAGSRAAAPAEPPV